MQTAIKTILVFNIVLVVPRNNGTYAIHLMNTYPVAASDQFYNPSPQTQFSFILSDESLPAKCNINM